ncbi:ATP-dependent DNA helicase RecG [Paenisporosarcina cavernae]|uniref:ATP-dependent DNA helicase RecG n=1 Tax=Paenisporosarcina cavernae TaxID=2320858 RepID=A0A385YTG4_9BACL|nr:ATP-dependent DNA helicase RecG [Paenisporosarcina cavernae]AYC29207.1 ATP-dependent DNA helicase RecG [Paenisporosarcina cavernae]
MTNLLDQPISTLKGVGQSTTDKLHEIGIDTIRDVIFTFPYRHEDFRLKNIVETPHNERITVEGRIESEPSLLFMGNKKSRLQIHLLIGAHLIKVVFFNQAYLKSKLVVGDTLTVTGKWDRGRQIINASTYTLGVRQDANDYEPVYSIKGVIPQKNYRKLIRQALEVASSSISEILPQNILQDYQLMHIQEALEEIHFPTSTAALEQARRRFIYEELFLFQLKIHALKKIRQQMEPGVSISYDLEKVKAFIASLPYELTTAQKRVVNEISKDLKTPHRMNRLLQGDVGSGKTVVAAITMYAAITAGYQTALMAPTEILAEQHAETLHEWFKNTDITMALLTGSTKQKVRRVLLEQLKNGEIDLLIGTHALIQQGVDFKRLGFVITDEQHRFGVEQRRVLKDKGENPDVLFMTATPIPRTLAITAFGEMDVSTIDELPTGRKQIETHWLKKETFTKTMVRVGKELEKGRQAYVICPLIEESEKLDLQNAVDVYNQLTQLYHGKFTVGLMHGRLSSDEKEQVMRDFSEGKIAVLVSTTVVEVGVNVPNATSMVIYDAERFGLSQLHQLRGRVGRGSEQSYCILLADPKTEEGKERMMVMCETNDGFKLAEKDLELRGPGDFFGKKQSGLPEFQVADLIHDYRALQNAMKDAEQIVQSDALWESEEYQALRDFLHQSGALEGDRLD